jgi:MoxR-like ATPase
VLSVADVRALQDAAERVHLSAELADYIVAVARETRRSPHLSLGVSPRGQLAWRNAARAAALAEGRDYVLPDDLKSLAAAVLAHRIVPSSPVEALTRSRSDVERVLADIIDRLPAPG